MKSVKYKHLTKILYISILIFVITAAVSSTGKISGIEESIFTSINKLPSSWRYVFSGLSQAGSQWFLFGVTLILIGTNKARLALRFFSAGVAAYLSSELFKYLISKPRPNYILPEVYLREIAQGRFGYPSGHTTVATVMALVLMFQLPKKWHWVCYVWIALVGISRIYLGVHAPLDAIGGVSLGIIIVLGSIKIQGKLKFVRKITGMRLQG